LTNYSKRLIHDENTGAKQMLKASSFEDMGRLYALLARGSGAPAAAAASVASSACLADLRECVSSSIKHVGSIIVTDVENLRQPRLFVSKVLEVRSTYLAFVSTSFRNDRTFARAVKEAMENFINHDTKSSQYLSLYTDDVLRKQVATSSSSSASIAADDFDAKLNDIISIFRYLQDKDIFEEYYKQHLSTRLLDMTSSSDDAEKAMISKLKTECGHQFTSRLEGMFKDIELSKQINQQWRGGSMNDNAGATQVSALWPSRAFTRLWRHRARVNV
jgi:cullin 3